MASGAKIPLFDRGKFIGCRSASVIEGLLVNRLVWLRRNEQGRILRAECIHLEQVKSEPRDQRLFAAPTIPPVTRYSYRDATVTTKPWDLKRLNGSRSGINYASGAAPADFLGAVGSCLRTIPVLPALRHNHSMPESLYLTIVYQPNPSSTLSIARVEQHPIFNNVARVALDQAEKRNDPETTRLAQVLELILPGFRE
jgi:hypothetical protein